MALIFYNTLTRRKEKFRPIKNKKVGLYTCGPTVYWYAHLGNLRTYIFEDILRRALEYNGYKVKHIMNITDVGHLTSDRDTGEDKIEQEAKKEKKSVWQIARFYTQAFKKDLKALNILAPRQWTKATAHIKEQINLIKILEKKGVTYQIADGIYFDTSKIKNYGQLTKSKPEKLKAGARVKVAAGKKNPTDFALWKFSPPSGQPKRQMEWPSPWGKGFPGWHIECSAMAMKYLGPHFDIHTGGIDHIPIHHNNEIAQSETATGRKFVNYWLHGEFLILDKGRMGKSEKNIIKITDLIKKKFNPLAFRYLTFMTHYRSKLLFSWDSLKSAQNALDKITQIVQNSPGLQRPSSKTHPRSERAKYEKQFLSAINNDLDTPQALAVIWQIAKDKQLSPKYKKQILAKFDKVLGLNLGRTLKTKAKIPLEIKKLSQERENARQNKNWSRADQLRRQIEIKGWQIEDTPHGPILKSSISDSNDF